MNHSISIIIPHRDRVRELRQTLWALGRSAERARSADSSFVRGDYEIIVVHAGDWPQALLDGDRRCDLPVRDILDKDHPRVFNKPRLLNLGIKAARGTILTFLDADMLVGPNWMHTTQRELLHTDSPPTRLCYRVRQLALEKDVGEEHLSAHEVTLRGFEQTGEAGIRSSLLNVVCNTATRFSLAAEAYGEPHWTNNPQVRTPVFGNSQWSILRDVLGDLRFDEAFEGAGFEDLDFIDTISRSVPNYTGKIITDPFASLYHLHHARASVLGSDWCDPKLSLANQARYHRNAGRRRFEQRERNIAKVPE